MKVHLTSEVLLSNGTWRGGGKVNIRNIYIRKPTLWARLKKDYSSVNVSNNVEGQSYDTLLYGNARCQDKSLMKATASGMNGTRLSAELPRKHVEAASAPPAMYPSPSDTHAAGQVSSSQVRVCSVCLEKVKKCRFATHMFEHNETKNKALFVTQYQRRLSSDIDVMRKSLSEVIMKSVV